MSPVDVFSFILVCFICLLWVVSLVFFISGLDDFLIDVFFVLRAWYRAIFIRPKHPRFREEQLHAVPEQPIAVMIPAWQESSVIRAMLSNTLKTLNYKNYQIFVGTYPNDTATQREVAKIKEEHANVHCIVCPHDGPTNKADCLNWIYNGTRLFEKVNGVPFAMYVMQDCEDIIHPLCYKLFNYLIPRKDMVQLPVFSLPVKWNQFTAGHYIDEFAQSHYKDIIVREMLDRCLPCAGVGCAFSRKAFFTFARENNDVVFSTDSLTEDYDFGLRMKKYKLKQIFAKVWFPRTKIVKDIWGRNRRATVKEFVCVREYFPDQFQASVRQKSRWVLGIALQGWKSLGWRKSLIANYMLFRDRKALVTNFMNLAGYLIVFLVVGMWITIRLNPDSYQYPSLFQKGTLIWYVIIANFTFFGVRIFQRAYCVYRIYGWQQSFLSFPRMIWGNVINFLATSRAVRLYARHLVNGQPIAWDKTAHRYPTADEMEAYQKNLESSILDTAHR